MVVSHNGQKRSFTRWSSSQTEVIQQYFSKYIEDCCGLPGKIEIEKFLKRHPSINFEWTKVRNKVVNERMAYAKRRKYNSEQLFDVC